MAGTRLTRDLQHSMLGGVCSGIANRYGFDVTLVRIVTVLLTVVTSGVGVPVYIATWIVMPREDSPTASPRPIDFTPDGLNRDLREVADRLTEAAHVLAGKTREAAEEISEIARRARAESTPPASTPHEGVPPVVPMTPPDAGAPTTSATDPASPSSLPRAMSEQSPQPPPVPPAGPTPPAP